MNQEQMKLLKSMADALIKKYGRERTLTKQAFKIMVLEVLNDTIIQNTQPTPKLFKFEPGVPQKID